MVASPSRIVAAHCDACQRWLTQTMRSIMSPIPAACARERESRYHAFIFGVRHAMATPAEYGRFLSLGRPVGPRSRSAIFQIRLALVCAMVAVVPST